MSGDASWKRKSARRSAKAADSPQLDDASSSGSKKRKTRSSKSADLSYDETADGGNEESSSAPKKRRPRQSKAREHMLGPSPALRRVRPTASNTSRSPRSSLTSLALPAKSIHSTMASSPPPRRSKAHQSQSITTCTNLPSRMISPPSACPRRLRLASPAPAPASVGAFVLVGLVQIKLETII